MRTKSILLACLLLSPLLAGADEVRILNDRKKEAITGQETSGDDDKAEVVRQFFEFEGVSLEGKLEASRLEMYDGEPLAKMRQLLAGRQNFLAAFTLNGQINQLLYERCKKRVADASAGHDMDLVHDEALLQALDLIVPDSSWSWQVYGEAKDELRQFCLEQPARCRELLERVRQQLDSGQLHTTDAITALESFFHAWIPLGRLTKYLQDFGEQTK